MTGRSGVTPLARPLRECFRQSVSQTTGSRETLSADGRASACYQPAWERVARSDHQSKRCIPRRLGSHATEAWGGGSHPFALPKIVGSVRNQGREHEASVAQRTRSEASPIVSVDDGPLGMRPEFDKATLEMTDGRVHIVEQDASRRRALCTKDDISRRAWHEGGWDRCPIDARRQVLNWLGVVGADLPFRDTGVG